VGEGRLDRDDGGYHAIQTPDRAKAADRQEYDLGLRAQIG